MPQRSIVGVRAVAWLLVLLAVGGASCVSSPRNVRHFRLVPATFADLDAGQQVAGISLADFEAAPDSSALDQACYEDWAHSSQKSASPPRIRAEGVLGGDFDDLSIEYARLGAACPAVGVVVTFRAGHSAATALELETGELYAFSRELGPLFRTAHDGWLVTLAPAEGQPQARHTAVRVLRPEFFQSDDRRRIEELLPFLGELRTRREFAGLKAWRSALQAASGAGCAQAGLLLAELEADSDRSLPADFASLEARFGAAPFAQRLALARDAAEAVVHTARTIQLVPPGGAALLERFLAQLGPQCWAEAGQARDAGRALEAEVLWMLAPNLEQPWFARDPDSGEVSLANLRVLVATLSGCAFIAERLPATLEGTLIERLERHAELACDLDKPLAIVFLYLRMARLQLAHDFEQAGREAVAKNLPATACGHFMLAHALAVQEEQVRPLGSTLEEAAALLGESDGDPFSMGRRQALLLAARFVPFVRPTFAAGTSPVADLYAGNELLRRGALSRQLLLDTGSEESQARFAAAFGAPLLTLEIGAPEVLAVQCELRSVPVSKTVNWVEVTSNEAAVEDWRARVSALSAELQQLDQRIGLAREASEYVTGTLGFKSEVAVGSRGDVLYVRQYSPESAASIVARAGAAGRAADFTRQRDELLAQYEQLLASAPPGSSAQEHARVVDYRREFQDWYVLLARNVRLEGGGELYEERVETAVGRVLERVRGDAASGIEAIDQWQSEAEVRADEALLASTLPRYAELALNAWMNRRIDAYEAELGARGLSESEVSTERGWLRYIFALNWDETPVPEALAQERLVALAKVEFRDQSSVWDEAVESLQAGKYAQASELFERCAEAYAEEPALWSSWAGAHFQLGQYDLAIRAHRRAAELGSTWIPGQLELAMLLALTRDWESASAIYDEWLERASTDEVAAALARVHQLLELQADPGFLPRSVQRLEHPSLDQSEFTDTSAFEVVGQ